MQIKDFRSIIDNMAASSLRCVAFAYKPVDLETVPEGEEERERWQLPEDDLIFLGIVGLKVR